MRLVTEKQTVVKSKGRATPQTSSYS